MHTIASPQFYVYVLCRPNGKPFYVGKGKDKRIYDHEREAQNGHQCHKCNVIRKIWKSGGEVQRYVVFTTDDEQEALAYEVELIALYGHKSLTNVTEGGEGASGRPHTLETRAKMSAMRKGRTQSTEWRTKLAAANRARWADSDLRARVGQKARERMADPERRRQASDWMKARTVSAETRRKTAATKKAQMTIEARARISEQMRQQWANPDYRARVLASRKAFFEAKKASSADEKPRDA